MEGLRAEHNVRVSFSIRLLYVVVLAFGASAAANAASEPQPGTYRGKGAIEVRVTGKVVARERFEVAGVAGTAHTWMTLRMRRVGP